MAGAILVGLVVGVGALRLLRDVIRARRTGPDDDLGGSDGARGGSPSSGRVEV